MNELVELHLRTGDVESPGFFWRFVAESMVRLILDAIPEAESADTTELRARVTECRDAFAKPAHPQEERQMAAACVKVCEQYLRGVRLDRTARENELMDMVSILREAAARILGESSDLNDHLTESAGRLRTMTRLDDIRDLKRQLTIEVTSLERVVEEKRQRDEAAMRALSERVVDLEIDLAKAEQQATIDVLTKVPNRAAFDRMLQRMMETARTSTRPLTLAMIDVDHFKTINDVHGHLVGDRVLLCTAEGLRASVRQTDFVARYGGEEFAVLLDGADLARAEKRIAHVLEHIASRSYEYDADGEPRSVRFTVSCGVAQYTPPEIDKDFVGRADQALYDAKRKGRNCVIARKPSILSRFLGRS